MAKRLCRTESPYMRESDSTREAKCKLEYILNKVNQSFLPAKSHPKFLKNRQSERNKLTKILTSKNEGRDKNLKPN
jgi:hypothetical protein